MPIYGQNHKASEYYLERRSKPTSKRIYMFSMLKVPNIIGPTDCCSSAQSWKSASSTVQHFMIFHCCPFPTDHENLSHETNIQRKHTKINKCYHSVFLKYLLERPGDQVGRPTI